MMTGVTADTIVGIVDEADRQLVRSVLSDVPGSVRVTTPDAVDAAFAEGRPALVVASVREPGALERVVSDVRSREATVPIVVAPPSDSDRLAAAAARSDADGYAPIGSDELTTAIERRRTDDGPNPDDSRDGIARSTLELIAESLPEEAFILDEDGTYMEASVRSDVSDLYTVGGDDLVGRTLFDAFDEPVASDLVECVRRAIETGDQQRIEYEADTTGGRLRWEGRVNPIEEPIDGRRAVVWLARDITERARREESLRQQRDQLETLNRINDVVRGVIDTLVEAPTRSEIEDGVCRRLVESDLYCGAWIGERTGDARIEPRTDAGAAERYFAALDDDEIAADCGAISNGLSSGEAIVTNAVQEADGVAPRVRAAAREDDVNSVIAVPIGHDGTVYGLLVVLARREDAFSERERNAFTLLGDTIGFAINAVMNRRLLFADTVVELELRIDDGDAFSFDVTSAYDCTVDLEWAGTTSGGLIHQYVTVDGLDGETAIAEARGHDSIESARLIREGDGECTLEFRLSESGVRTLTNYGTRVQSASVADGTATVLVEAPRDVDVRRLLETFRQVYPNARLVARREVDREVDTAAERRKRIAETLTDRQLTALRLAYYGGYFDWPRGTTGEEIAEKMEISPPTMHQHLRSALSHLLTEFFEEPE